VTVFAVCLLTGVAACARISLYQNFHTSDAGVVLQLFNSACFNTFRRWIRIGCRYSSIRCHHANTEWRRKIGHDLTTEWSPPLLGRRNPPIVFGHKSLVVSGLSLKGSAADSGAKLTDSFIILAIGSCSNEGAVDRPLSQPTLSIVAIV